MITLTDKERAMIRRVRSQLYLVDKLTEKLKGMSVLGSPKYDGMPRAVSGSGAGLEATIGRREEISERLQVERRRLRQYERQARNIIERLDPKRYRFCVDYYIHGLEIKEIVALYDGDPSERSCTRYKREIEGGDET